jgi:hypothetical protein
MLVQVALFTGGEHPIESQRHQQAELFIMLTLHRSTHLLLLQHLLRRPANLGPSSGAPDAIEI